MKMIITCIKCAKEMMQQSITETDEETLKVFFCEGCKYEILLTKENCEKCVYENEPTN